MSFKYTAVGKVMYHLFPVLIAAEGSTYRNLIDDMADATQDVRYYLEGVNGGINHDEAEPYTKDLTWPEVQWTITREEVKE